MSAVAEQTGQWLAEFTKQDAVAPWMQELRAAGFARFAELGFPNTHNEEWRFTNVAPIARAQFAHVASIPHVTDAPVAADPALAEQYLGKVASFGEHAFLALNTAFLKDLVVIHVPRGTVIEKPIRIDYTAADGTHVAPRALIIVGADAHCTIVESYSGTGKYFTNAVTEIVAGDRSVVDHYKVQREDPSAFHVATLQAQLGRSATFSTHSIALGGAIVRNEANVVLSEGTDATVNGLYIVNGTQHVDNHTVIDHAKPHGTSHEMYKGILDDKSAAVFNGRIIVRKDAQKTDSKQTNKNLVLSDDAVIDTKPELQILADDVRCTHGATIGQLDAESLFYLQSRGIGKQQARSLLTYAFAQDVIDRIQVPDLREQLEKYLFEKFHEVARA
ncbi:MAG TPA: Fe-S cluster assembly protein SufD [Bryobacteraceae bacterium]|jgi:Fe-S cluster assembly protein SufD|nr:Fe-S cluster assembly protein SufD [Bryobacteraceae bacterium]